MATGRHARKHGCAGERRPRRCQWTPAWRLPGPARQRGRGGGARHDPAEQRCEYQPSFPAERAHQDEPSERQHCQQDNGPPKAIGIQRLIGAKATIREYGQYDHADQQQLRAAADLRLGQLADAGVQELLETQQRQHDHGGDRRNVPSATGRQRPDGESRKGGDGRGQSHHGMHMRRHQVAHHQIHPDEYEQRDEHAGSPALGQQPAKAAEQADQRKGANARDAMSLGPLALLPSPFQADQKSRSECQPEPDQRGIIEFTHRLTWTRSRMKSRCSPSEASVRAIDTWRSVSMPLKARMASMVSGITIAWLKTW